MSKELNYKYAVTHPAKAHRDDFYTCCIILATCPGLPIDRRIPTEDELNDPEVLIVDIGERHEPEKGNFDHHQFEPIPENETQSCALSLWLAHLGYLDKAREYYSWLGSLELADCLGPHALARQLDTTWEKLSPIISCPLEDHIIQEFSRRSQIRPNAYQDWLCQIMFTFGSALLRTLEETTETYEELEAMSYPLTIHGLTVIGFIHNKFQQRHSSRVTTWTKRKYPEAAIIIIPDNRNEHSSALMRLSDHPQVDFRRLEGKPLVNFVHKNGFIAKVTTKNRAELQQFCAEAIIPATE